MHFALALSLGEGCIGEQIQAACRPAPHSRGVQVRSTQDSGRLTIHLAGRDSGPPEGCARGLHDARTEPPLSRIRKNGGVVDDRKSPSAYSPFTRITVTELPGNVWRMADSPTSMPNVTGATLDGLASEFSSVGLSEASTTALAGPVSRAMPRNPMSVASVEADALTTLRMMSPLDSSRVADAWSDFILGGSLSGGVRRTFIGRESRTRQASGPGCAGVLLGPGTVDGGQGQIQRCGVVQRPGVAAAIVTESEDDGEFQNDVGIG